jgi:hypothetical protein
VIPVPPGGGIPAATSSAAGLMSAAVAAAIAATGGSLSPAWYTPLIDLTATSTGNILVPAMPGFLFAPSQPRLFSIQKAGAISTSFTYSAGNDGSHVNIIPSATPATTVFSATGLTAPDLDLAGTAATIPLALVDLTTPITVSITAGATGTGGFAWKGRFAVIGMIVPNS